MDKIGDLLKNRRNKGALTSDQVDSVMVCAKWEKVIEQVNEKYKNETKALVFRSKVLLIEVCSASQMLELQMMEKMILDKYQQVLGVKAVERVKFRVG